MRTRKGLISVDPRTLMGLIVAFTLIAFVVKPFWIEVSVVIGLALLQALCGHVKMSLVFLAVFAALIGILDYAFAAGAAVFLSSFVYIFTLTRRIFEVLMVYTLLTHDNSAHRIIAALRKLRLPEAILIPLSTSFRYFPTFKEEAGHIRDSLRLRNIPASERIESFVVPLMISATTTADELSRAAVCRGIENPAPRTDTEHLRMSVVDWIVLVMSSVLCIAVIMVYAL